ncbi:hypothetical protein PR202_ga03591 [Eleusine coracana subsp. coracana]|uniref:Uncharacterized protein n=1 Tax=Eleusine coracana subsp. coracana TaxID=191504 RepID=A0AAV5BPG9_ELECO|nr:hypothetical protein PR202_ga03591 [Eleusine coracana subsp. coracana]
MLLPTWRVLAISREIRMEELATTIPVRNVQALAACSPDELTAEVIERYIRPDIDHDAVVVGDYGKVPVVDLSRLLSKEFVQEETSKLMFACEEWGFFQLLNHGIAEDVIFNIKRDIQEFFQLPLEAKNAYTQRPGDLQGYGQSFVVSNDQKLDWADMFAIMTQPPEARDLKHWPTQPHTFRHGAWIPVQPRPDAFLVIVGDFLEIMSNGKYKSVEHRVIINPHMERLSVSAFHNPKLDGVVSPIIGAATNEDVLYKTVSVNEYMKHNLSNKLDGKKALDYAKEFQV